MGQSCGRFFSGCKIKQFYSNIAAQTVPKCGQFLFFLKRIISCWGRKDHEGHIFSKYYNYRVIYPLVFPNGRQHHCYGQDRPQ